MNTDMREVIVRDGRKLMDVFSNHQVANYSFFPDVQTLSYNDSFHIFIISWPNRIQNRPCNTKLHTRNSAHCQSTFLKKETL